MTKILVIHGPNLNLLGIREPDKYGHQTLNDINAKLKQQAQAAGFELTDFQSNREGTLIDRIHEARENTDFIIFNPAAFTHTSIALRDALLAVQIPFIEVHLTDIKSREPFRHHSYFSDIATEVIAGHGATGYELALKSAIRYCAD